MGDIKITLKKGLKSAVMVILSGLLSVGFSNPWFMALVPLLEMALNYLKHRED